jgi:hypothetical protein
MIDFFYDSLYRMPFTMVWAVAMLMLVIVYVLAHLLLSFAFSTFCLIRDAIMSIIERSWR